MTQLSRVIDYRGVQAEKKRAITRAIADIWDGLGDFSIVYLLAWQDIKTRYRRSTLGPFWLTISAAITILTMGFLYGGLFKQDFKTYLPYVAAGILVWTLISTILTESCSAFSASAPMIQQIRLPLTVHVARVVLRNIIILAHNTVVLVPLIIFFAPSIHWGILTVPIALLAITLNGVWVGLVIATFCARFRDIMPLMIHFIQLFFFATPVFWKAETLGAHAWVVLLNPFYHFIEIFRTPLLGGNVPLLSWFFVMMITFVGFGITILLMSRYRARVAYWV